MAIPYHELNTIAGIAAARHAGDNSLSIYTFELRQAINHTKAFLGRLDETERDIAQCGFPGLERTRELRRFREVFAGKTNGDELEKKVRKTFLLTALWLEDPSNQNLTSEDIALLDTSMEAMVVNLESSVGCTDFN